MSILKPLGNSPLHIIICGRAGQRQGPRMIAEAAKEIEALEQRLAMCSGLREARCCAAGGDFYNGIEWMACWLLDHAEGQTITEEELRPWAIEAWKAHLKRHNDELKNAGH